MRISLESPARRATFALIAIVVTAGLAAAAVQSFASSRLIARGDISSLWRAHHIDPMNAEPAYRLARVYAYELQNWGIAIPLLQEAARLNPHASAYWVDLATAAEVAGDSDARRAAL